MDITVLERQFGRMGARVKTAQETRPARRASGSGAFSLDVQKDGKGEHFLLRLRGEQPVDIRVLDVRPRDRHLLLMVREGDRVEKQKFLCGHDERSWFVAAVPEHARAATVRTAMEALKPAAVQAAQEGKVRFRDRARRKTAAYRRQGEWFFLPCPDLEFDAAMIRRSEPLVRGQGSKPHRAEECVRTNGVTVYVCAKYPNGVTETQYKALLSRRPLARNWGWLVMRRDMQVYVRGRISHADHKTIVLPGWHRVVMNTENQARAMRNVAFLD